MTTLLKLLAQNFLIKFFENLADKIFEDLFVSPKGLTELLRWIEHSLW